jgi:hypothetical protein
MPDLAPPDGFDVFLSHASADKAWARTLRDALERLSLRVFFDEGQLRPGANWVSTLSDGVQCSRFLVLVFTPAAATRPWVEHEWTSFMAKHGPERRVLPVLLEEVPLPAFLAGVQGLKALDRDADRVAQSIATHVGKFEALAPTRYIGQSLFFVLKHAGDQVEVTAPGGRKRTVPAPWGAQPFTDAQLGFDRLSREWLDSDHDRAEVLRHATALGRSLFDLLFDEAGRQVLFEELTPGRSQALLVLRSDDDQLLSLP